MPSLLALKNLVYAFVREAVPRLHIQLGGDPLDLGTICIAHKSGDNNVDSINTSMSDGDVMTANGIKYTYPFDACPGGGDVVATPVIPDLDTTTDDEKDDDTPTDDGGLMIPLLLPQPSQPMKVIRKL